MSSTGEVIQIHIGQAGIQIANACWELYCLEHGIMANGCVCQMPQNNSYNTFFSFAGNCKVVPRLVMVDLESTVIDEIRTGCYQHLFHPHSLISGKEDAGSNFTRAYCTIGREMIDLTMDRIRHIAEDCPNLQGFILFRSIGGGTGSGFGTLLLENLYKEYAKKCKLEFIVFPSPSISPVIVEPYNAVLATHCGMDFTDCTFLVDNEALYDLCASKLDVTAPSYTNLNRIIGQAVSAFTSSLRFDGSINVSLPELQTNLVPYPRIHFPLVSYAPLNSLTSGRHEHASTKQLTNSCFQPDSQLVKCNPSHGKYMSCVMLYRGDNNPTDINYSISEIKQKKSVLFVDWSLTGFKVGVNNMPPTYVPGGDLSPSDRALCMVANNTIVRKAWCRILEKFAIMYSRRAFIHHYVDEGLDESTFTEANEDICTLITDYKEVDS